MARNFIISAYLLLVEICFEKVGIETTNSSSALDIDGNLSLKVEFLNGEPVSSTTAIDDRICINLTPSPDNAF